MIEERWGLPPRTVRDACARSLADVLVLNLPVLVAPRFAVPGKTFDHLCPLPVVLSLVTVLGEEGKSLYSLAKIFGFI